MRLVLVLMILLAFSALAQATPPGGGGGGGGDGEGKTLSGPEMQLALLAGGNLIALTIFLLVWKRFRKK